MDTEEETIETPEVVETPEAPEPEGELVVQIGEEEPEAEPEQAPEWVRNLRRENRELQKRLREIEAAKTEAETPALPAKPKLDDFDYDTDAFETALENWYDTKRTIETKQAEAERAAEQAQQAWQAKVATYQEAKAKVPYADFDDAEAFVQDTFDATQQGLLIKVSKDAPTLVYALGRNPKKAAELAQIKDYAEFVAEAVRLEMNIKTTRKPATAPEKAVIAPSGVSKVNVDQGLERIREEVAQGKRPFTDIQAYKRKMKA